MILAILFGLLIGYFFALRHSQHLILVAVFFRYRSKESYEDLYELCDTEFNFEITKGISKTYQTYHEFLITHQAARPVAGEIFLHYWKSLTHLIIRNYLIVLVGTALLFQSNFIYFALVFFMMHLGFLSYYYYYKDIRLDFCAMFIHYMVISDSRVKKILKGKNR